jgi:hypothetical protein
MLTNVNMRSIKIRMLHSSSPDFLPAADAPFVPNAGPPAPAVCLTVDPAKAVPVLKLTGCNPISKGCCWRLSVK